LKVNLKFYLYILVVKDQEAQTTRDLFHKTIHDLPRASPEKTVYKKIITNLDSDAEFIFHDKIRSLEECVKISKLDNGYSLLSDDEVVQVFTLY